LSASGRGEAAHEVVEDILIEGLQVGDLFGRLLQLRLAAARALGERAAQATPPRKIRTRSAPRCTGPRSPAGRSVATRLGERQVEIPVDRQVLRDDDAEKEDRAEAGELQSAAAELHVLAATIGTM
jgi:hypothetical protein